VIELAEDALELHGKMETQPSWEGRECVAFITVAARRILNSDEARTSHQCIRPDIERPESSHGHTPLFYHYPLRSH
jgi:hypothetical protein